MTRIAVVGAGVAGLTVAYGLRTLPVERTVFEKSRGYGGRAATRGQYGCRYDHGAPFFSAPSARVERLITAHLPTEQLVEVGRSTGGFNRQGDLLQLEAGATRKWTYRHGISTLGKLLGRFGRAEIVHDTRIERLEQRKGRWGLRSDEGARFGPYDAVVLTAPAPQTASILERSALSAAPFPALQEAVVGVDYAPQFSYVLAYDRPIPRPGDVHGLVSVDDDHPLARIGFEHDKPGHVRGDTQLLVVHTAPTWTAARVDRDPEAFLSEIKAQAAEVLGTSLRQPVWYDTQRWRYARPLGKLPAEVQDRAAERGLYFAGDFVAGTGEVGAAIDSGFATARRLRASILA